MISNILFESIDFRYIQNWTRFTCIPPNKINTVFKPSSNCELAVRTRFKDSVDFIGWYTSKSSSILNISKIDAFKQYVAYHEGWGNYKYYKKNKKIINLAKRVERQSNVYKNQLKKCSNSLNKNKYIIF